VRFDVLRAFHFLRLTIFFFFGGFTFETARIKSSNFDFCCFHRVNFNKHRNRAMVNSTAKSF